MNKTIIAWTKVTWNPVHGCSRVSEGCRHCYAEALSLRYGWTKLPWTAQNAEANVREVPAKLREPYSLKEPSRIFVNSMSDLFHPLISPAYRDRVFAVMADLPQHTFQVLTKRPELAAQWHGPWPKNIWLGASIESARHLDRLDHLRQSGAQVRFVSAEPLISAWGAADLTGIDWVIVGGESGPEHRPMPHTWAREIRDMCLAQDVAFFFKQSAAYRTEMGTTLQNTDGTFWTWQQWPDQRAEPVPGESHKFTCESIKAVSLPVQATAPLQATSQPAATPPPAQPSLF